MHEATTDPSPVLVLSDVRSLWFKQINRQKPSCVGQRRGKSFYDVVQRSLVNNNFPSERLTLGSNLWTAVPLV